MVYFISESSIARILVDCELDVAYGPTEYEKLDIFGGKRLPNGRLQNLSKTKENHRNHYFTINSCTRRLLS